MLRRVALVRTDVPEECTASIFKGLVTVNVPSSSIIVTLIMEAPHSSKTPVLTRATWRNIPEDEILKY
jgi:hypothetical protein